MHEGTSKPVDTVRAVGMGRGGGVVGQAPLFGRQI